MATMEKRNIDSKNRQYLPDFITIRTPSKVVDGVGVSELGTITLDSHLHDLDIDGGEPTTHERRVIDLKKYVATGVLTQERAESLEEDIRVILRAVDFVEENYVEPVVEEPVEEPSEVPPSE
jgi:hypothetical protein